MGHIPTLNAIAEAAELRERCAFYERTNAEQAAILNRVIAERDDYREALEYGAKRMEAFKARDLKCDCDHNEYCSKCFPLDFRVGGMFYKTPDSVIREALAKHTEDEVEQARRMT